MDILQVIPTFPPVQGAGGPPNSTYQRSRYVNKFGHNVTVYTTDRYSNEERYHGQENITLSNEIDVYRFRNVSHKMAVYGIPIPPGMIYTLKKNINQFDIVHLHSIRSPETIFIHLLCEKYNIPYIIKPGGSVPREGKATLKMIFDKLFGERIFNDASAIQAVSKFESDEYTKVYSDLDTSKIIHIPNGVNTNKYNPNATQSGEFRSKYDISEEESIILYLGRLNSIKRPKLLLKSFDNIHSVVDNARLVFVGPDEGELGELKRYAEDKEIQKKTVFIGGLYDEEKLEAYIDANVFVLPSRYDSFGIAPLEAMACKIPTIVSNSTGIIEYADDESLLVFEKQAELEHHLVNVISDEEYRKKLANNALYCVNNRFDWSVVVEEIVKMYEHLIRQNP